MSNNNKPTFIDQQQSPKQNLAASPFATTTTTAIPGDASSTTTNNNTTTTPHQYETIESLRAQLALAQENYKRQIKNLRAEKETLQHELHAVRQDCGLLSTRLDDAIVSARKAEESEQQMKIEVEKVVKDNRDRMDSIRARQSDAPAIDEAIFKNYKELRTLLFDRCGAEFMSVEEQWHFARSTPIAVLEMTRAWIWKFTECFQVVTKQMELQKDKWRDERTELLGAMEMFRNQALFSGASNTNSPLRKGLFPSNGNNNNNNSSMMISSSPSPQSGQQQQQQQNVTKISSNKSNQNQNQSAENNNNNNGETFDQLQSRIQILRRECGLSKAESLRAHKAAVVAETKQKHLQQMLEKAHKQLHEAIEATSTSTVRKQVDEVKKQMRLALSSKDDEIGALKQQFEKDVVALTKQIQGLSNQNSKADRLHAQLTVQRQENRDLKSQVARMDVKTLEEHKQRADRELMELRSHTSNLETSVDTLKLRLAASKQLAVDAKQKYSTLFDAHLQEARTRQTEAANKKLKQIRRDVVGSDSALTKYHFEQKYQALSQDLAATQQKLKRLIMIAHHDQVAHDAEIEQMQMQAVAYYEKQQKKEESEFWNQHQQHDEQQEMDHGRGKSPINFRSTGNNISSSSPIAHQGSPAVSLRGGAGTGNGNNNNSKQQHATDRNLFHADGAIRESLQQNVIVGENKATVEEISRVAGEGVVQDVRSWTSQPGNNNNNLEKSMMQALSFHSGRGGIRGNNANNQNLAASTSVGGFEVSGRTAIAASVAKSRSDMSEYFAEREKQEASRQQKKVSLSTMGHSARSVGEFVSPGGLSSRDKEVMSPASNKAKPPRPNSTTPSTANNVGGKPTQNSIQFFIEGSATPGGVRERRVL